MEYNELTDLLFIIIILIIPFIAQLKVSSNYNKYLIVKQSSGLSGFEVARKILDNNGLDNVHIVETRGKLTDHYDPTRKVIRLSHNVFHGDSIASVSIAAHECGHAVQDKTGYVWMRIRSIIFPIVNIATSISYVVILIGILAQLFNVVLLGIVLTAFGLIFQIVTLPVEFDASNRAKDELRKIGIVKAEEQTGVNKVLGAAAMTYVAGVLSSALEIVRLLLVFSRDD